MPAQPLPDKCRVDILEEAPYHKSVAGLARALGLKPTTLESRLDSLDIRQPVKAMLKEPAPIERTYETHESNGTYESSEREEPAAPAIVGTGPRDEPDIEAIILEAERRYANKSQRAERKEHQTIRFSHGPICLVFLGDEHFGNHGTDVKRARAEQKIINATPGSYVWHMGDPVDNFVVGRLMAENMKPSSPVWDQWALAKHYFKQFGDKLVAYCGGNHDAWTMMLTGIDYRRDICPDGVLYDGDQIRADVHVGTHVFRVWSRHRWTGNSIYNATHGLERAARFDTARYDVYVGAHVHRGAVAREFMLDGQRKLALMSGSYKVVDDFAVSRGFTQHDNSTAVALVLNDSGSMFATSDLHAALEYMQSVYR